MVEIATLSTEIGVLADEYWHRVKKGAPSSLLAVAPKLEHPLHPNCYSSVKL